MTEITTATRRACCGVPLIPTMIFSGAEYYCRECKGTYGMMSCPDEVEMTTEMQSLFTANVEWFRRASKDCIPHGARFHDCESCYMGDYHEDHVSQDALEKSRRAYAALMS